MEELQLEHLYGQWRLSKVRMKTALPHNEISSLLSEWFMQFMKET